MRSPLQIPIAPLALTAVLVGCHASDGPTASNDSLVRAAPEAATSAVVQRSDLGFLFLVNEETGSSATIGLLSPIADLPECGGSGPVVLDGQGTHQEVVTPTGALKLLERLHGELVLYDVAVPEVCDLIGVPVLAHGPGNWTLTLVGPATNVLGVSLRGTLELTSGGRAHLRGHAQITFNEDGTVTIHVDKSELKPIGG